MVDHLKAYPHKQIVERTEQQAPKAVPVSHDGFRIMARVTDSSENCFAVNIKIIWGKASVTKPLKGFLGVSAVFGY